MADNGYQVDPQELTAFAGYLTDKTVPAVTKASSDVHAANGFDNKAFGIFVGQALGVPARIALSVVGNNLDGVQKEITDAADRTRQAASTYLDHEQNVAIHLQTFNKELS